jgi:hypothetical protein
MRAFVIDDEFFNHSATEATPPGVHAFLCSKDPLTPQTLLEMSEKPVLHPGGLDL